MQSAAALHDRLGVKSSSSDGKYEVLYEAGGGALDPSNSFSDFIFAQSYANLKGNLSWTRQHLLLARKGQKMDIPQGQKVTGIQFLRYMNMQTLASYVSSSPSADLKDLNLFVEMIMDLTAQSSETPVPMWLPCGFAINQYLIAFIGFNSPKAVEVVLEKSATLAISLDASVSVLADTDNFFTMPRSERVGFLKGLPDPRTSEQCLVLFDSSQHLQAIDPNSIQLVELLGAFPRTACTRRFRTLVERFRAGIRLCEAKGPVMYTAQLYPACVNFQLMNYNWADMNQVISAHSRLCLRPSLRQQSVWQQLARSREP